MNVSITLASALAEFRPAEHSSSRFTLTFDTDSLSVSELLAHLGIPEDYRMMVLSNGQRLAAEEFAHTTLQDADSVTLVPPIQAG